MRKKTLSGDPNFVSGDLFTGVSRQKATWEKIQLGALKKWVPATYCWGYGLASHHPIQGGVEGLLHATEGKFSMGHVGLLWFMFNFYYP